MRTWVYLLFFISGFTGLLYEIVWIRTAGTVLGNTTYAVGTVVGVYMGGMALGAWRGGRAADRRSGAALLRLYGLLEGGVAVTALLVPWLIAASGTLLQAFWDGSGGAGVFHEILRVGALALVLALPTTLMGATLPVLARYLAQSVEGAAREAGKAYALNTFGGVAGTLAAGFWLVPSFGLRLTTTLAVAANLGIALAAVALSRGGVGSRVEAPRPSAPLPRAALAAAAASGFAALVYEVAWTRMIVLSVGSTVYSFTIVLAVFIFGLAAGSALGARFVGRAASPTRVLGYIQLSIGVVAMIALPLLGELPVHFAKVMDAFRRSFDSLLLAQAGIIMLFILPPTLLMGAAFPFACRMAATGEDSVGRSVAGVYTWNTLGSIVGTFLATFLILPSAGPGAAVQAGVAVNMATSAALAWSAGSRGFVLLPAAVVGASFLLPPPSVEILSSGSYLYGNRMVRGAKESGVDLRTHLSANVNLLESRWDAYGLVTVHQVGNEDRTLRINGKVDASTNGPDMATQQWLAHLPLLHHAAPRKALVIGLGAGITAGTAASHGLERVDCVEISPAVAGVARHFSKVNGACMDDPRVRVRVGDGRQLVQNTKERYDAVICEPSNLWLSGMANLFTQEFFREAGAALAPGGILCQWVHAYRLSTDDFRSVLRTFFSVFPGGGVWEVVPGGDYLLLGTAEARAVDWSVFERRTREVAEFARELNDPYFTPSLTMAATLVADAQTVKAACGPGVILTDDFCPIEYTAPKSMHREHRHEILEWLDGLRGPGSERKVYGGLDGAAGALLAARRAARRDAGKAMGRYMQPPGEDPGPHRLDSRGPELLKVLDEAIRRNGPDRSSRLLLEDKSREVMGEAQASSKAGHPDVAALYLESIPRITGPYAEARVQLGNLRMSRKDAAAARALYLESLEADPRHVGAAIGWALSCQQLGRLDEELEAWTKAAALQPQQGTVRVGQAAAYFRLGRLEEARAACQAALALKPEDASARELMKRIQLGAPR